jgi:hypothetical protein
MNKKIAEEHRRVYQREDAVATSRAVGLQGGTGEVEERVAMQGSTSQE